MHLIKQVSLCPSIQSVWLLLFKCRGGDNAHWISKNKMAETAVQWELCGTNFCENIANLGVSCYNGNNDWSARVLFVQHPREQGEWLRQNPRYARVLTASFALLPRVLDEQRPRSPVFFPNRDAGDLRCHDIHSDAIVAETWILLENYLNIFDADSLVTSRQAIRSHGTQFVR